MAVFLLPEGNLGCPVCDRLIAENKSGRAHLTLPTVPTLVRQALLRTGLVAVRRSDESRRDFLICERVLRGYSHQTYDGSHCEIQTQGDESDIQTKEWVLFAENQKHGRAYPDEEADQHACGSGALPVQHKHDGRE